MGEYLAARLEKRKDLKNGWRAVLDYIDGDGKRRKKTKALKARTKAEATRMMNAWWAEMESEAERAKVQDPTPSELAQVTSVSKYVDAYLDKAEATRSIEGSTLSNYRNSAKKIAVGLSDVMLSELVPTHIVQWEAQLAAEGLGYYSIATPYRLLKTVLNEAVWEGLIRANPCDMVKPPKRKAVKEGINALDKRERERVMGILEQGELTPLTVSALIALYTGMRRGEVCALRWTDIDRAKAVAWVRRSIGVQQGGTYVKETKTGKGRDVALPARLMAVLQRWRMNQPVINEYVTGTGGSYYNPSLLTKEWKAFVKTFGVKGVEGRLCTFHDLRHTWATAAVAAGIDIKTVSSNLGHANAAMTLNIYASADPDAKRRAAEVMDEVI